MRIKIIIGFLLAILLVIFTVQNSEVVNVKFLMWQFAISRALLIVVSMATGALAYSLIALVGSFSKKKKAEKKKEAEVSENQEEQ